MGSSARARYRILLVKLPSCRPVPRGPQEWLPGPEVALGAAGRIRMSCDTAGHDQERVWCLFVQGRLEERFHRVEEVRIPGMVERLPGILWTRRGATLLR